MSVSCEIIRDLLPLYLDGVCSDESRKMVEEHLLSCDTCKEEQKIMAVDINTVADHADDKKIAKAAAAAWKKRKKKSFLTGLIVTLAVVLILVSSYAGFHWFSSAQGDDLNALSRQAASYLGAGDLSVTKTAQRGNYLAALCKDNDGKWYMCEYEKDAMFKNRWSACAGTLGLDPGEFGSWNFGSPEGETVLIFSGVELSDEICFYTFQNCGITYTCPIENNTVLDIFIIQDSHDINGSPTALDKNQQPLEDN